MKKRILSIFLALCMVLCLMPMASFAENGVIKDVGSGAGGCFGPGESRVEIPGLDVRRH